MKKSIAATAATLIAVLVVSGCSALSSGDGKAGAPGSAKSQTTPTGDGSTPPGPAEVKYYDNGDLIFGTDIKAGVYRGEVEDGAIPLCTASQTTEGGKVIDIRNANEGSVIFTVVNKPGSTVTFSGCANIALAKDILRKGAKPGNGYFLVGDELAPGKYSATVDKDSAITLGTVVQQSEKGKVMDIRNANSGKVVFTVRKSKGSVVSFSGFSKVTKVG